MRETKGMRAIYLDHAATTSTRPEVLEAMLPYFTEKYGNPSGVYGVGQETRKAVDEARDKVAELLGAKPEEIIFTSGGSESDNMAIKGVAFAQREKGNHIITSSVEHHAVLHTCEFLGEQGFEVTFLPVDGYGRVDPEDVKKAVKKETILISIMHSNNEVGTIEPIPEIGRIAREAGIPFHTDAVQSIGNVPVNVDDLGVDMLSLSAHKFYGPKGVGALYVRKGTRLANLIHGGGQERGRRAGTENVAGIVGLARAMGLAITELEGYASRIAGLRDRLIKGILESIPRSRLNGHPKDRLPGNANFCIEFAEGEAMLLNLDMRGIAASSGSACTSGSLEPSHVLLAMGIPPEIAHGSLRFSIGRDNTEEDIDHVLEVLPEIVKKLREMSPLWDDETSRNETSRNPE